MNAKEWSEIFHEISFMAKKISCSEVQPKGKECIITLNENMDFEQYKGENWYDVFIPLIKKIINSCHWIALGFFEYDGPQINRHWLYFIKERNSQKEFLLSLIGRKNFFDDYLKDKIILSEPLSQVIRKKIDLQYNIPLIIQLKKGDTFIGHCNDKNYFLYDCSDFFKSLQRQVKLNIPNKTEIDNRTNIDFVDFDNKENLKKAKEYIENLDKQSHTFNNKQLLLFSNNDRQEISLDDHDVQKRISNYLTMMYDLSGTDTSLIFTYPAWRPHGEERRFVSIAFIAYFKDRSLPLDDLDNIVTALDLGCTNLSLFIFNFLNKEIKKHSIKAAIAAIMSRNMSHNIGSHVLAKVSGANLKDEEWKEWGRDFQILSQYLQQRQDFIAQIATEWPSWTYPTWLMKDLMRWFLSQKHILNYIASAEDLRAHIYSSEPEQESTFINKKQDIRLHVFKSCKELWDEKVWKIKSKENESGQFKGSGVDQWQERINQICPRACNTCQLKDNKHCSNQEKTIRHTLLFTGKDEQCCCLDEDIQLAIPGGIIGYHAFYTILENVIRNGAKHSFTKMKQLKKEWNEKKFESSSIKKNIEKRLKIAFGEDMEDIHMDVIIEFLDEDEYLDNNDTNTQLKEKQYYRIRVYDNVSFLGDKEIEEMNNNFRQDIITETGELKKGNWGLAEMKISAGYLQKRGLSEIGMGREAITSGDDFIIRATISPLGTLAYEFRIPKPKEVGIVCLED